MSQTIIMIRNASAHDFGGGERFPIFVSEVLKKHDYTPVIMSGSAKLRAFADQNSILNTSSLWLPLQNWSGWRVILTPIYLVWQCLLLVWYLIFFIYKQPCVVHIQSRDDFIAGSIAARFVGSRVIWTDHADLKHVWRNLRVWYKNPIGKLVYYSAHLAHAITLVSKSELEYVVDHLPSDSPIIKRFHVIHNGCKDRYDEVDHTPYPSLTYCIASRLVTDKGIAEAINAFRVCHERYQNSQLLIVGNGPEREAFEALAGDLPSITFTGHLADPIPTIARSNIFLQPTYHEGFSVSLVEACMLGLPIIATGVGGNVEIIRDNTTGLLVPPKNTDELQSAMLKLAGDPSLRTTLAQNARKQYLESFVLDSLISRSFVPLYRGELSL